MHSGGNGRRAVSGHRLGQWHQRARHDDNAVRLARLLRDDHGKTYKEIAKQVGAPWRTVADWCNYVTRADA